ncbi:MAG: D-alanine--D-alanine ligase family protein [Eubacteriales bacterium]
MTKQSVLCLFGGKSTEYKVSLMSVCSVLPALNREKYEVHTVGITEDGRWFYYSGSTDAIRDDTWHTQKHLLRRAMLSPSFGEGVLYVEGETRNTFKTIPVDVVLPVVHGAYCEDGTLQGLLSMTGIPYVGPHCAASAVAMDKTFTKLILNNYGIPQAKSAFFTRREIETDPDAVLARAEAVDSYPLFVKPANAGSSIGVSKASDRTELLAALRHAASYDDKVIAEECIVGREVECAVLGNDDPVPSVPGEINPGSDFYDYDTKYITDTSADFIPARISDAALRAVRGYAERIYTILGCKGLSRVDFFVTDEERIVFNEINTLPGFTRISMYPKLWNYMGKTTPELLDALIELAQKN